MTTRLAAHLDPAEHYYFINVTTGGYGLTVGDPCVSLAYLCGLLNSRVLDFYFRHVSTTFHGGYFAANKQYIEQLPIRPIDFSDGIDKAKHDRMVALVERMLELNKRRLSRNLPSLEAERAEAEISVTDAEIDDLVYELYGITREERKIIEGGES